jgi:hypothetical protein
VGQPDKESSSASGYRWRRSSGNVGEDDDGRAMGFHVGKWSLSQLRG